MILGGLLAAVLSLCGVMVYGMIGVGRTPEGRIHTAQRDLYILHGCEQTLCAFHRCPTAAEGIAAVLADCHEWKIHGSGDPPRDPWGRPYVYEPPSAARPQGRVLSLGGDGKPGGEGEAADIVGQWWPDLEGSGPE